MPPATAEAATTPAEFFRNARRDLATLLRHESLLELVVQVSISDSGAKPESIHLNHLFSLCSQCPSWLVSLFLLFRRAANDFADLAVAFQHPLGHGIIDVPVAVLFRFRWLFDRRRPRGTRSRTHPSASAGSCGSCGSFMFIFFVRPTRAAERQSSASEFQLPPRITRGYCVVGQLITSSQLFFLPSNFLYQSGAVLIEAPLGDVAVHVDTGPRDWASSGPTW